MITAQILPNPEDERASEKSGAGDPSTGPDFRPSGIHPKSIGARRRPKWTVVKTFVREGHHYQLRRRPIDLPGQDAELTKREEQVLACALDGQSNKSIAYTLGVAASTVGVLLFRAATKLGAKSRAELLSTYARRSATAPTKTR